MIAFTDVLFMSPLIITLEVNENVPSQIAHKLTQCTAVQQLDYMMVYSYCNQYLKRAMNPKASFRKPVLSHDTLCIF
jgi:hypothetical protein